ncbi:MAG: hypothetical protein ABI203_09910 [Mucilaginibacter sp.]
MLKLKYAKLIMLLAAIYNAVWGIVISVYPQIILFDYPQANFTFILLRCIGMLVGTYAIAYYFASRDPDKILAIDPGRIYREDFGAYRLSVLYFYWRPNTEISIR